MRRADDGLAVELRREEAAQKLVRRGEQSAQREHDDEHEEEAEARAIEHERHELPLLTCTPARVVRSHLQEFIHCTNEYKYLS